MLICFLSAPCRLDLLTYLCSQIMIVYMGTIKPGKLSGNLTF